MEQNQNVCLFENDHLKIWQSDGVAILEYLDSYSLSADEADEIMDKLHRLSRNHPTPLLIDARSTNYLNRYARNLFSSRIGSQGITAAAIVVNSETQKKMVNLWFRIDQPDLPFRLYTDWEDAIYYLQFFKNPN